MKRMQNDIITLQKQKRKTQLNIQGTSLLCYRLIADQEISAVFLIVDEKVTECAKNHTMNRGCRHNMPI
jgi:hypothetical protein